MLYFIISHYFILSISLPLLTLESSSLYMHSPPFRPIPITIPRLARVPEQTYAQHRLSCLCHQPISTLKFSTGLAVTQIQVYCRLQKIWISPFLEPDHSRQKNCSLLIKSTNTKIKILLSQSRIMEVQDRLDLLYQRGTRCLLVF